MFIVSNQAIINRGLVPASVVDQVNGLMLGELDQCGARVEAVAYCPHRADENCLCRKPKPGLLMNLALRFGVNLTRAVVIGDALSDMEAGLFEIQAFDPLFAKSIKAKPAQADAIRY